MIGAAAVIERNPLVGIELPPNDEKPRTRVADAEEGATLLAPLSPRDAVPYALAFYCRIAPCRDPPSLSRQESDWTVRTLERETTIPRSFVQ